jgi:hypothetical protein
MEKFGVKGSELGEMLEAFHETFSTERARYEWLAQNSREEALERFKWANVKHFDEYDEKMAFEDETPQNSQNLHQDAFRI